MSRDSAVNFWRNTRTVAHPRPWLRFDALNAANHELRRALLGIDAPTAWCGDRNARIRRYILAVRRYPKPSLP